MFRSLVFAFALTVGALGCASSTTSKRQVRSPDGALFWEYQATEGIPDGISRTYHDNGKLRSIGTFINAELHGMFERYREDGEFDFKGFFWHDVLVWESRDEFKDPPAELLTELATVHDPDEVRRRFGSPRTRGGFYDWLRDKRPPSPRFLHADWRDGETALVGARLRFGGATAQDTAATSQSMIGQVPSGDYAVFVMATSSQLHTERELVLGRQLLEFGGSHRWQLPAGTLVARAALSFPVAPEDPESAIVSAVTVPQAPALSITANGSTAALRSSASWIRHTERWGFQVDLGLDQTVAGREGSGATVLRGALGLAYGARPLYGIAEVATARRLDGDRNSLFLVAAGAALRVAGIEAKLLASTTMDSIVSTTLGIEHVF